MEIKIILSVRATLSLSCTADADSWVVLVFVRGVTSSRRYPKPEDLGSRIHLLILTAVGRTQAIPTDTQDVSLYRTSRRWPLSTRNVTSATCWHANTLDILGCINLLIWPVFYFNVVTRKLNHLYGSPCISVGRQHWFPHLHLPGSPDTGSSVLVELCSLPALKKKKKKSFSWKLAPNFLVS